MLAFLKSLILAVSINKSLIQPQFLSNMLYEVSHLHTVFSNYKVGLRQRSMVIIYGYCFLSSTGRLHSKTYHEVSCGEMLLPHHQNRKHLLDLKTLNFPMFHFQQRCVLYKKNPFFQKY